MALPAALVSLSRFDRLIFSLKSYRQSVLYFTTVLMSDVPNHSVVNPFVFQSLRLGSIQPLGWLEDEMGLMSEGLAGHELDFYRIVRDSPWLGGGTEYSGLNEGLPYWFNGLVPLAYGVNSSRLKGQVNNVLDYVLDHQQNDGWLGPEEYLHRDLWGRFPLCLGLMQLVDADPAQASRIVPAINKFVNVMRSMLKYNSGLQEFWGRVRYPDMIIVLQWMYEKFPQGNQAVLLETMQLLDLNGLHWKLYYNSKNYIFDDLDTIWPPISGRSSRFPPVHAVNAGQGTCIVSMIYRWLTSHRRIEIRRCTIVSMLDPWRLGH